MLETNCSNVQLPIQKADRHPCLPNSALFSGVSSSTFMVSVHGGIRTIRLHHASWTPCSHNGSLKVDRYIPKKKAAFRAPCYHIDIFMSLTTLKQTWLGNAGKFHVLIVLIPSQKKWCKNFPIYPKQRLVNVPFWGFASHHLRICWRLQPPVGGCEKLGHLSTPKYSWISSSHGFSSDKSFRKSQSNVRGVHCQSVVGFPVNGSRDVPYLAAKTKPFHP